MDQDPLTGTIPPFPFMSGMPMFTVPVFSPFPVPIGPFPGPLAPVFDPSSMTMGMPGVVKQEQLDQFQKAVLEAQKQQLTNSKKYIAEVAKSLDQALVKIDEEIGKIEKRSSEKREKRS